MANRYWVGGTGTWNTTSTANWSTSSGGASGASVPTASDSVFFDQASTYTVTLTGALTCLDLTVSAGTVTTSSTGTITVSGNFNITSATVWGGTGTITFNATSSITITTNAVPMGCQMRFDGAGGTFNLNGALNCAGPTLTQSVLSQGTLALNNYNFTCVGLSCGGTSTRSISFGTGQIYVTATAGNALTCTDSTNFTVSGTRPTLTFTSTAATNLTCSNSAATALKGAGNWGTEMNFKFIAGTYTILNFFNTAKSVDFTGFSGTWGKSGTVYIGGDVIISSTMNISSGTGFSYFVSSGTQTITTNGKFWNQSSQIGVSGFAPTVVLADAFSIQSISTTKSVRLANGTLNLNGNTMTMGTSGVFDVNDLGSGFTSNITFNGGTIVCTLGGFTYTSGTFTTTAGTSAGKISMTGTATFAGGGKTYNCNLSADVAGTITITGANTFTTISNGVTNAAFVFPASTTTTVTNWNVSGASGSLCTITSSTPGTQATLSKSSGTVSSNYLSLQDSAVTGGATWYAGAYSTNVSNNTNWLFSNAPSTAGFLVFM